MFLLRIHTLLSVLLGLFFIYSGSKKFVTKKPRPYNPELFIEAVEQDRFIKPVSFKLCVKMLKVSGFLKFVGVLQILSGLLLVYRKTRLTGLLLLLPLTVNIFAMHFFMDNRLNEDLKTGMILFLNILLIVPYYRPLIDCLFKPLCGIKYSKESGCHNTSNT